MGWEPTMAALDAAGGAACVGPAGAGTEAAEPADRRTVDADGDAAGAEGAPPVVGRRDGVWTFCVGAGRFRAVPSAGSVAAAGTTLVPVAAAGAALVPAALGGVAAVPRYSRPLRCREDREFFAGVSDAESDAPAEAAEGL